MYVFVLLDVFDDGDGADGVGAGGDMGAVGGDVGGDVGGCAVGVEVVAFKKSMHACVGVSIAIFLAKTGLWSLPFS